MINQTETNLMTEAINHLRAAAECLYKLKSGGDQRTIDTSLSGSSPVSLLVQRCRNGVKTCLVKKLLADVQAKLYLEDIAKAEQREDTKYLNILLGRLKCHYKEEHRADTIAI